MSYEDSDWDDDGVYDEGYDDDDAEADTHPCPECGAAIYEESVSCPSCGCYLDAGWAGSGNYPWWTFGGALSDWGPLWLLLGMGGVLAVIFVLMMA